MIKKLTVLTILTTLFLCTTFLHARNDEAAIIPNNTRIIAGHASWYSRTDPGVRRHTANNEIFDDQQLTCAMWNVPFNQMLRVTNLKNGKSVIVRVNDRGPHKRYVRKGRVIDLSKAAFQRISAPKRGLISVQVEFL